jgi:hypothetical protein
MVHGPISDHTTPAPLIGELRDDATTFAMDRRGFEASPDGPGGYSAEREFTGGSQLGRARRLCTHHRPRGSHQ